MQMMVLASENVMSSRSVLDQFRKIAVLYDISECRTVRIFTSIMCLCLCVCVQAEYLQGKVVDEEQTFVILSKLLISMQIIVPTLVNVTWRSYFLDMMLKCVHVADPTYVRSNENELKKMHDSNVKKILCAMTTVVKELYSGWEFDITTWDTNYLKPIIHGANWYYCLNFPNASTKTIYL